MRKLWKKRSIMAILTAAMLMNDSAVTGTVVHASETLEQSQDDLHLENDQGDSKSDPDNKEDDTKEPESNKAGDKSDSESNKADNSDDSENSRADSKESPENSKTDSQERSEQVNSISGITEAEPEIQLRLVSQTLSETIHGVAVNVTGRMPENARLHIDEKVYKEEGMEYDISILYEDGEYIPEEYGEKIQVSFEFVSKGRSSEEKIYTIYDIEEDYRQLGVAQTGEETSFTTDRLSRYVIIEEVNYEGVTQWEFGCSGNSQGFTAPVTGVYRFDLYGAQGSAYQEHQGGKGGMVSVQIELAKNEEVELVIGGENGFNGGGNGSLSNGGGATRLLVNGVTAAIAGGGGGATDLLDGGNGGETQGAGTNTDAGDSSQEIYSAGGGGGYLGGTSGYTLYHEHTGDSSGGGCYTSAVRHVHSSACDTLCGTYQGFSVSPSNSNYIDANCNSCGAWGCRPGSMSSPFIHDGSWKHTKQTCGKNSNIIEYYNLGCGKQNTTVESKTMAYGGTSYYNSALCRSGAMTAGVQEGDGKVLINMLEMDGATLSYYNYDMTLLGSITVAKGDKAGYPLTDTPVRADDNKYSYEFAGWDHIQTDSREIMTNNLTAQDKVTEDRDYMAVYRNIPKKYVVTLESDGSATAGTQTVTAVYGESMPEIVIPHKTGYLFAGYFTKPQGAGIQYYTEKGDSARNSEITENTTLYAYWVQPLTITEQPRDLILRKGYRGVVMETNYTLNISDGYTVELQWYVDHGTAVPISDAGSKQLMVPTDYHIGTYKIWCELKVTSEYNGQNVTLLTDKAELMVMKGLLQDKDVICTTPKLIYDGEPHAVAAKVNTMDELTIYYGEKPLDGNNYSSLGEKHTYSYTNAGNYKIYVYITGEEYEDYAGCINMDILKSKWVIDEKNYPIVHKNGTVTFPGGESWEYYADGQNEAQYQHYKGTKLIKGEYIFRIEEDENHYASENIVLTVDPVHENQGNSQTNGSNNGNPESNGGDQGNSQTSGSNNGKPGIDGDNQQNSGTNGSNNGKLEFISDMSQEENKEKGVNYDRKQTFGDQKSTIGKVTGRVNTTTEASNGYLTDRKDSSKDKLQSGILERTGTNEIGIEQETQLQENELKRVEVSFVVGTMILIILLIFLLLFLIRNRSEESNEEEKDFDNRK